MWDEITYPIPNFNNCTIDVLEWIRNCISHFTEYVINYPCWTTLVKGPQEMDNAIRRFCDLIWLQSNIWPHSTATSLINKEYVTTSSNRNISRVTGPLWRESTGDRWIPLTKASDAERWCFLWSAPEQTDEQTVETRVIWDVLPLIMTSL